MRSKIKIVVITSLFFNLIFLSIAVMYVHKNGGINYLKKAFSSKATASTGSFSDYYTAREGLFESLPDAQNEIVFLGDSITERGEWSELFSNSSIKNRGISADTTDGVLNRLKEVTNSKPQKIFIMIGINDLYEGKSVDEIISNDIKIIEAIKSDSPNTQIFFQSVLPVNNKLYGNKISNDKVIELDKRIEEIKGVTYINLYNLMSVNNQLKNEFTFDGLHLTAPAYKEWKNAIKEYV